MTILELIKRLKLLRDSTVNTTLLSQTYQVSLHKLGYIPGDIDRPSQGSGWELAMSWQIRPSDVMYGIRDLSRGPNLVFMVYFDKFYRYDRVKKRHTLTQEDILDIGQTLADGRFPDQFFDDEDLIFIDIFEERR